MRMRRGWIGLGWGLFLAMAPCSMFGAETADLIFTHGKIITVDEAFSIADSMAIRGDRILAVGQEEDVKSYRGSQTEWIDLKGKALMPGLIDSHAHPADACLTEFDHPVPDMETIADVLNFIRERARALPEGKWIFVSQVFLTRLEEGRYPTRAELDAAAPRHPTVFRTGPDASVNTLALQRSGIDKNFKVTDGGPGYAEKDAATGEPTGILRSCTRVLKYVSPEKQPMEEEHAAKLKELFADYNRVGLTAVGERDASWGEIALYQRLQERDELNLRAYVSLHVDTIQPIEEMEKEIIKVRRHPLYEGVGLVQLRTVKTYLDGGMLTGSAYMREPWGVSAFYNISDPQYRGVLFIDPDKLVAILDACMKHDVQYTAHSVGDGAVHTFLDACNSLQSRYDIRAKRPVICHSNFMSAEAVETAARLGVAMDLQPAWLYLDSRTLLQQFGQERMRWFQPLRSLFAAGAIAGGGSDHMQKIGSMRSINFYNPWMGMCVAMTRQAHWVEKPIHPEEALSRVEALRFYTINNAYLQFAEHERGSLEPGKLADFIILKEDPLTCPVDHIKTMEVEETYVGGRRVYAN